MSIIFNINYSDLVINSNNDLAIEKHFLGLDDSFTDFPDELRLEIKNLGVTSYMSFILQENDGVNVLYKCTGFRGEKLLIVPKLLIVKT